jgi:serine/threonine protein phosphatase PrpC
LRFETAEVSLRGDRDDNQDRAAVLLGPDRVLIAVVDGMGGHAEGARAAEAALASLKASFDAGPAGDATLFLRRAMERAHRDVVGIGEGLTVGSRPRATCAACLVHDETACWAHVGDARVYLVRAGAVAARTRDHTPIETLLQEGLITEEEVPGHPMRHFVEYCLGGFTQLPEITVAGPVGLCAGDLLLACSDGLWAGVPDAEIAASAGPSLEDWLTELADRAVRKTTPYADNTTAAALRLAPEIE